MAATKPSDETVKLREAGHVREFLGEWCIRKGLATAEEIESCLRLQRDADARGTVPPRLGEILVARGILTHHQVAEALAAQKQEIRSCTRCGIQINVTTRGDAASYHCGRCQGLLRAPEGAPPLAAVDEEFLLVSKDPVPEEVEEALGDPAARFGKYVLLRRVGQGGIGVVYLAWDTYLSQYVALKRLRTARPLSPEDTPAEHIQSLLKEARNSIRLRHPGIVSVFDVGRVGREYYVAMEFLEGETLAERIQVARGHGRPSPFYEDSRAALAQLTEIARALQYAHGRPSPIVHCDLKPANILVDRELRAHVLDFGLARNLHLDKPEKGEISGTPSYMAPEQASGESDKIDRRTDVYAFGAVLYEMLTGRPPFVGGTIEILGKTLADLPVRPSDALRSFRASGTSDEPRAADLPLVPAELEELCMRCLKKDRSERPQSMDEVVAILEARVASEAPAPPSAAPAAPASLRSPGTPERSRRPRAMGVAIAVSALALAGGSALVHSFLSAPAARPAFDGREREVYLAISRFQADLARSLAVRLRQEAKGTSFEPRATRVAEEAQWVARLRSRVAERLVARPVDVPPLKSFRGSAGGMRIQSVDDAGVHGVRAGRTEECLWESIDPATRGEILRLLVGEPEDADLLGLAIVALRSGQTADADRLFARLRSSALGPVAERYQLTSDH